MDSILLREFSNSITDFKFDHFHSPISFPANKFPFRGYELNHDMTNSFSPFHTFNPQSPEIDLTPSSSSQLGHDPNNNAVLKYISDMLMEEDLEGKTCMLQDCLALQAAEKSLYDALGQDYPLSLNHNSSSSSSSLSNSSLDAFGMQASYIPRNGVLASDLTSISPASSDKEEGELQRGRKNHQREESDDLEEERTNKHSALSVTESEPSDMFDEVLLCRQIEPGSCGDHGISQNGANFHGQSKGRTARGRRRAKKGEVVDLPTLLTQCAQSVAISDQRTSAELLKQIRQHSSPFGDGNQRLAHHFANALEARLAGKKTPTYTPIISNNTPVTNILKAYQVYVKACPFRRMTNFFANQSIFKMAEKAARLHIVDFGILYGFQWPCLIQRLSERPGGPPKLRITAIELPQPGFRPAERVEETGRRLQRYCERFRVPFEYNIIAQKFETITCEDLNIDSSEMTIVNCTTRMRNVPDDTVVAESARDAVLELIRRIRPKAFIHGVVNGTYNAPFFVTRFKEAIFHYSSVFDMFDVTVAREDEHRMVFEKEIYGKEIMNVIACEGTERIERPETYKQWQARNMRAGFRQVPLDREILKKVRGTVRSEYHKDFVVDDNGEWMLQGWKGRVICALSVWKPVYD